MNKRTAIAFCVLGTLLLIAAGVSAWKQGPNPETVCTRGADKVILCIERTSLAAANMSREKRDEAIPACMADPEKVSMYETCLHEEDCDAFMTCVITATQPKK